MTDEELKDIAYRVLKAKMECPGDFWIPNVWQANFVKLIGGAGIHTFEENEFTWHNCDSTDKFMNFGVCGNGSGKTYMLGVCAKQFLGIGDNRYFHIDWDLNKPLYPFFRYPTGSGDGWIISNSSNIKETISPVIIEMLGDHPYEKFKDGRDYYSRFIGKNKRTLVLKTYEQAVEEFRGKTLWWAWFDEPERRPDILKEVVARFRRGGKIIFTLCPLGDAAFCYNIIQGNTNWSAGAIYADAESNCKTHGGNRPPELFYDGVCGVLNHEDLMRLFEGYTPEEREARQHARFAHLSGVIFPTFTREIHVVRQAEIPTHGTLYFTIDPHMRRAPFCQWWLAAEDGRTYLIDEFPHVLEQKRLHGEKPLRTFYWDTDQDNRTIEDYAQEIFKIEKKIGTPSVRIMDGRFQAHTYANTRQTVLKEYADKGIRCIPAECDKTIEQGHEEIKMRLAYDLTPGHIKMPRIFFEEHCLNTIAAMELYCWDTKSPSGKIKPDEEFKDPIDCARMFVNYVPKYIAPETIRELTRILSN